MTKRLPRVERRGPTLGAVILVAAAFLILIGLQAHQDQVQSDRQTAAVAAQTKHDNKRQAHEQACAEVWSNDLTATLQVSRDVTQKLRDRDKHWHKRVDSIFQLLIMSRTNPAIPDPVIDQIVADYQQAKSRLFASYAETKQSNADNPLPALNLNCTLPKKGPTQ